MTKEKWLEMCEKIAPLTDEIMNICREYMDEGQACSVTVYDKTIDVFSKEFECLAYQDGDYKVSESKVSYATIKRKAPAPTKATGTK